MTNEEKAIAIYEMLITEFRESCEQVVKILEKNENLKRPNENWEIQACGSRISYLFVLFRKYCAELPAESLEKMFFQIVRVVQYTGILLERVSIPTFHHVADLTNAFL